MRTESEKERIMDTACMIESDNKYANEDHGDDLKSWFTCIREAINYVPKAEVKRSRKLADIVCGINELTGTTRKDILNYMID